MDKKLILKLKLNKEDKSSMIMQVGEEKYNLVFLKGSNVLLGVLDLINIEAEEIDKISQISDLKNLFDLIQKGFTIRIDDIGAEYRFTSYIDKATTGFIVSKKQGLASLLKNAEDWAETMLEELGHSKKISGVGINSLLETIDDIYNSL